MMINASICRRWLCRAALPSLLWLAAYSLAACQKHQVIQPIGAFYSLLGRPADELVATVAQSPIHAAEVAVQAKAEQVSPRQALAELIDAAMVAQDATARGLNNDPEVIEAAKQAMVRRYLALTFEHQVTAQDIPDDELRGAYERNRNRLDHPDLVEVRHVLARFAKDDSPERRLALRQRAEQVALAARGVRSPDEFSALGPRFSDDKIKLRVEELVTAQQGWTVPPFAAAAFALARPGDTSPVVESKFGYHIIYLVRHIAAEHITFEAARAKLRELMWPDFQRRAFARFADQIVDKHQISIYPQLLESAEAIP